LRTLFSHLQIETEFRTAKQMNAFPLRAINSSILSINTHIHVIRMNKLP